MERRRQLNGKKKEAKEETKKNTFVSLLTNPVLIVICLGIAFYYGKKHLSDRTALVLQSLEQKENNFIPHAQKIGIGFGACQDLLVDSNKFFEALNINPPKSEDAAHFRSIRGRDELQKMFAYFFQAGAAAERFVRTKEFFKEITGAAKSVPTAHYTLGGNAPVMAARFVKDGANVLLGAKMSEKLRKTLPESLQVAGETLPEDDVHLILEYKADATWGPFTAPRANRFIMHSDGNNPQISSLEEFIDEVALFEPNLLVIGGLHMMDNVPLNKTFREQRIKKVQELMRSQKKSTYIHFEMASYVDETLMRDLTRLIFPYVDSMGMNEQELPNLISILRTGRISVVSDSNPRVATVLDEMRELYILMSQLNAPEKRSLTRLHVHTLAYQAILVLKGSKWTNSEAAAAKASLTAHKWVCKTDKVDLAKARLILDDSFATTRAGGSRRINVDSGVMCWDEDMFHFCVAPNLVCTDAQQTAGAGDNISAAALIPQIPIPTP